MIFRNKDLVVLIICSLAVLWSFRGEQQGGGYYFVENWVQSVDVSHYRNDQYPLPSERLPKPVITDLDRDGLNEIIFVNHDCKIYVLDGGSSVPYGSSQIPLASVKREATLVRTVGVRSGRRPIGLGVGYLLHPQLTQSPPQQVIVVVTDGWTVLCFNHELKLLWESTPVDEMPHGYYYDEVTVMVAPHPIRIGDNGVVVVGGRLEAEPEDRNVDHEHKNDVHDDEEDDSDDEHQNDHHFSYYAFDGKTGAIRWKHEAGDFYSPDSHAREKHEEDEESGEKEDVDNMMPHHSYKQHVFSQVRHLGEVDWRQYKNDVLDHLPYRYVDSYDASFALDHFMKKSTTGQKNSRQTTEITTEAVTEEPKEKKKPNVIVATLKSGLEVIHLYTGRPLCRLLLPSLHSGNSYGAYADTNSDGVIDQIQAIVDPNDPAGFRCYALALTGVPTIDTLWNGTICGDSPGGAAIEFLVSKGISSLFKGTKIGLFTTAPQFTFSTATTGLNSIFYVSTGLITNYNFHGRQLWQTTTLAAWRKAYSHPVFTIFQVEEQVDKNDVSSDYVLAVGDEHMVLISGNDGSIVTTHNLPKSQNQKNGLVIVGPPVIGDFNNDGLNDVIIMANDGFYGFTIQKGASSVIFPVFVLILIGVMVYMLIQSDTSSSDGSSSGRKRATD